MIPTSRRAPSIYTRDIGFTQLFYTQFINIFVIPVVNYNCAIIKILVFFYSNNLCNTKPLKNKKNSNEFYTNYRLQSWIRPWYCKDTCEITTSPQTYFCNVQRFRKSYGKIYVLIISYIFNN